MTEWRLGIDGLVILKVDLAGTRVSRGVGTFEVEMSEFDKATS